MVDGIGQKSASDESLLNQVADGSQEAAEEVFKRHSPRLLAIAKMRLSKLLSARLDPEDIVQSTFKSFFRRASKGGYQAPETGALFNLLVVIAMRKINAKSEYHLAAVRDAKRTAHQSNLPHTSGDETQNLRDLLLTIEEICQQVSETQRNIFIMRLEGYTVQEISSRSKRSKRTVERELQEFRRLISRCLQPKD